MQVPAVATSATHSTPVSRAAHSTIHAVGSGRNVHAKLR